MDFPTCETQWEDMESESSSILLDSMELLSMSYSVMRSFDNQLCLLPASRWRWDRNNAADILCDPWLPAQRGKWALLKRVMCTGSLLSCNGMERIKKGAKWECLQREWPGDFVSPCSISQYCCDVLSDYCDLPVTHAYGARSWCGVQRRITVFWWGLWCIF